MNNLKENAIKLFLDIFNDKFSINDIKVIKPIHNGYTNSSYYLELNSNEKFQIRLGENNKIVNRSNEANVLKAINEENYIYYNDKNGNAIKKWIEGRTLNKKDLKNNEVLLRIFSEIQKYHNLNINNIEIIKHDYNLHLKNAKMPKKHLLIYKKIVSEFDTIPWGFSHNDLNLDNILLTDNNDVVFIDFEWSRINHPYWDYSNILKETTWSLKQVKNFSKLSNIDFNSLLKMTYVAINFSYQWTFSNSFSFKILYYRLKMFFKMYIFLIYLKKVISSS